MSDFALMPRSPIEWPDSLNSARKPVSRTANSLTSEEARSSSSNSWSERGTNSTPAAVRISVR